MRHSRYLAIPLAVLALGAAPPTAASQQPARPAGLSRIVSGAKGFLRNPFGLGARTARPPAGDGTLTAVPPEVPKLPPSHGTPQVPDTPRAVYPSVRRASWIDFLKRRPRPTRSVSEYMAEEKP